MCAYQIGVAAPDAALGDVPLLGKVNLTALLSDAILAFTALRDRVASGAIAGPLVVSNSWAMYDPATDFPPSSPSNYSHTREHPFNLVVESLVDAGIDVIFAAGNCAPACPYGRCRFPAGSATVCGANSLADVVTVGAVAVSGEAIGYSSFGGTIVSEKPDVLAYSQFVGSRIGAVDDGTSTACPLVAGVVAAIRGAYPGTRISPKKLRELIRQTSGGTGVATAWSPGTLDVPALLAKLP
jgi:subtilisin family serine protease